MLQESLLQNGSAHSAVVRQAGAVPDARMLIDRLRAVGCEPLICRYQHGHTGCGVSMLLSVQGLLQAQEGLDQVAGVIREQVLAKLPLTITLRDLGEQNEPAQALEAFCSLLHDRGVPRSRILGVCLAAPELPLRAFSLITRCWFGDGPRFALLGESHMQQFSSETWDYLWRYRCSRWAVQPAYAETVATPCPLLADEIASAILPIFGIQASSGTAWLPIELNLLRFADKRGVVHMAALERALIACVATGEQLLELLQWPVADMDHDARSNRRIAVNITGFGDLVRLQNKAPTDFRVLQSLLKITRFIRATLWTHSAHIARQAELLPAIAKHEPSIAASDGRQCRNWAARWQAAIERSATRHRNLLVMSPYSVLPAGGNDCAAFADLLPVIGLADAHGFAAVEPLRNWNFGDFCRFHRRARAVIQHRNDVSLVATRA